MSIPLARSLPLSQNQQKYLLHKARNGTAERSRQTRRAIHVVFTRITRSKLIEWNVNLTRLVTLRTRFLPVPHICRHCWFARDSYRSQCAKSSVYVVEEQQTFAAEIHVRSFAISIAHCSSAAIGSGACSTPIIYRNFQRNVYVSCPISNDTVRRSIESLGRFVLFFFSLPNRNSIFPARFTRNYPLFFLNVFLFVAFPYMGTKDSMSLAEIDRWIVASIPLTQT